MEVKDGVVVARNKAWGILDHYHFLEKDETPEDAALREVAGELGLTGAIASFVGYYPLFEMNQLIPAFRVQAAGPLRIGAELAEVQIIPKDELDAWSKTTLERYRLHAKKRSHGVEAMEKMRGDLVGALVKNKNR